MIISISGKLNSGKDLTGSIIAILLNNPHLNNEGVIIFLNKKVGQNSDWQIKKWADKLKDIVCILLGCSREQLEDREFKEKELGEEWWYFKGRNNTLIPYSKDSKRSDEDLVKPTPRFLLQFIGTNLFRNQLHPEIWVNSLISEYKSYLSSNHPVDDLDWEPRFIYPNWIITDTRFPNELEAVKKKGGIAIRVNRPCDICGGSGYHKMSCPVSKSGEHYSEIALDKLEFDYVVDNDSDIQSLIEKVKEILIKEKLL